MATNTFSVDLHKKSLSAFNAKYGGSFSEQEFLRLRAMSGGHQRDTILFCSVVNSETEGTIYTQTATSVITSVKVRSIPNGTSSLGEFMTFQISLGSGLFTVAYGDEFVIDNIESQFNLIGVAHFGVFDLNVLIKGYSPSESTLT